MKKNENNKGRLEVRLEQALKLMNSREGRWLDKTEVYHVITGRTFYDDVNQAGICPVRISIPKEDREKVVHIIEAFTKEFDELQAYVRYRKEYGCYSEDALYYLRPARRIKEDFRAGIDISESVEHFLENMLRD